MVSNHGACVVDGRVIVFGGDGRSSRVAHTLCYNPVKAKWSKLKVFIDFSWFFLVVFFFFSSPHVVCATISTRVMQVFGSVPRARSHHGVVAANGTQVFVFGTF